MAPIWESAIRISVYGEDSMKKPFHETTWSKVEVGDIALFAWPERRKRLYPLIVKVECEACSFATFDDKQVVVAQFKNDGLHYGRAFDPDEAVYVQSRL